MRSVLSVAFPLATATIVVGIPHAAQAQYMYLDTNGDGVHSDADTLNSSGSTLVDVWIRTDQNRDGSTASCSSGNEQLIPNSFDFVLHATGGTVAWGTFINQQAMMLPCNGTRSDSTDFDSGICGVAGSAPGVYRLASISLSVSSGTPSIRPEPMSGSLPGAITAFGSTCPGVDGDNAFKLGTDWFDVDGARYGGWVNPPMLTQPTNMTVAEGSVADQGLTATDPDGSTMSMSKVAGPSFMTVQTASSTPGSATGLVHLAPGYFDSGPVLGEIRVSDGIGSDFKSFGIHVLNTNRPPVLDYIPDICLENGQSRQVGIRASDPDRDPVTISGTGLPPLVQLTDTGYGFAYLDVTSPSSGGPDSTSFTIIVSDGAAADSQIVRLRTGSQGYCRPPLEPLVYPNPTPMNATLSFWTSRRGHLVVTLHDARGRRVRTLLDLADAPASNYRVPIDSGLLGTGGHLASGVYFYRVEGVDGVATGRLLLIRQTVPDE